MKLKVDEAIKRSGLKKGHIAKEIGVSADTMTNWAKNRSMIPLDKDVSLSKLLGIRLKDLYDDK
ncbi:helix-turn-helix domain-containing protein [Radiobacillus sp. PE A8.2]|uniref:helix-turn-helix domain-containing protein n=1 Tax=Radiobacillus sp. PE A8.2 TaxID=3380349 RepID=UPI003890FC76